MNNENLTDEQKDAIEDLTNNILIIAGPGSGKTNVLVLKVGYLLEQGYDPQKILLTTFTKNAANSARKKILGLYGQKAVSVNVNTIHGFCLKILQENSHLLNIGPGFRLITDLEQRLLFHVKHAEIFKNALRNPKEKIPNKYLNQINRLNEDNIHSKEVINYFTKTQQISKLNDSHTRNIDKNIHSNGINNQLAMAFNNYNIFFWENRILDYTLLLKYTLYALKKFPEFREKISNQYQYILVDEYQDTNNIQEQILKYLCTTQNIICVVGDDDQSIYKFRGARIGNLKRFSSFDERTKTKYLSKNFRSHKHLVDLSKQSIINNKNRFQKNLFASRQSSAIPISFHAEKYNDFQANLAQWILELVETNPGLRYRDIAIIYRSVRYGARELIERFNKKNIPYHAYGLDTYLSDPLFHIFLNILKLSQGIYVSSEDVLDILALLKIQNIEKIWPLIRKFPLHKVLWKKEIFKNKDVDILSDSILPLIRLIQYICDSSLTLSSIIYKILEYSGLYNILLEKQEQGFNVLTQLNVIGQFIEFANYFDKWNNPDIKKFLNFVTIAIKSSATLTNSKMENEDEIQIMTVHKAKGLEFPVVIVPDLIEGRFPIHERKDGFNIPDELIQKDLLKQEIDQKENSIDDHLSDERRLFYVACTRAKEFLILGHYDKDRMNKQCQSSRFINEIQHHLIPYHHFSKQAEHNSFSYEINNNNLNKDFFFMDFSDIELYKFCPWKYYLNKELNLFLPNSPEQIFGESIHKILQFFHNNLMKDNSAYREYLIEQFEIIVSHFHNLDDFMLEKGKRILLNYFNWFNDNRFEYKEVIEVERKIEFLIDNFLFTGKIDLLIRNANNDCKIIDFKTGPENKNISPFQVMFYGLGLKLSSKIKPVSATYLFLEELQSKDIKLNEESFKGIETDLLLIANKIKNKEFYPKYGDHCINCKYLNIACEENKEGDGV